MSINYAENGRKGGETTKARHGQDYYKAIGRKGGLMRARYGLHELDREAREEAAPKVRKERDNRAIGLKAAASAKRNHGEDVFRIAGARGAARKRKARRAR